MKKTQILAALLCCMFFSLVANDLPDPGRLQPGIDLPQGTVLGSTRTPPSYTFSRNPTALLTSFYDYMIGSYNGLPLRVIPQSAGGGYFLTYHGKRTATGTRRVFYAHLSPTGTVLNNGEITATNTAEGYPTIAVDPVSGKPMYAWHNNFDTDAAYEDLFTSDAFLSGLSGLFNDLTVIENGPITITPSNAAATSDNEFIWPTAVIGPSPVAGKRRVYVVMRNSVTHTYGPSENPYIRFADFNATDIENGIPLNWNTANFTIPEMDDWNHDDQWRRPFHALTCDNAGNLYYAGYHFATQADGTTDIPEADLDVFKCPNYGQGTWTRISAFSNLSSWNPPTGPNGGGGYFKDDGDVPYANNELYWKISNSSHINATVDDNGRIHVAGTWALNNADGFYYPTMQFMKEFVFNPATNQFTVKEIYPQRDPNNTHDDYFQPWDTVAPWGVVDQWGGNANDGYYPLMTTDWPFPYWDESVHDDAMMFHYNNVKVTESNGNGMMAVVWQNSYRSRMFNYYSDTDYAAYANTPEIWISVSPDNGDTWSEPIVLNNVQTPQLANMKPMWVYPADKVIYTGMQGDQKVGKLGLMFYNDYTWGANAISPPVHPTNDGGQVMFTELQIVFPVGGNTITDPFGEPVVLSGSMSVMAGVMIDGQMAAAGDVVGAFVNVGGNPQLRGKETVQMNGGNAGCLLQVYTESNGETVYFKVWDASANEVLNVTETIPSQVNGVVGSWPDNLFWLHAGTSSMQNISLQTGWNMVSLNLHPDNMAISSIFSGIMANVEMIKSPEGVYIPNNPYNTLTQFTDGKGYFVKVTAGCTLSVTGAPVNTANAIALGTGWNLVGYTPQAAMPVVNAISTISPYVIQVKGVEGIYVPGNPYNTLTTLSPGRAYWMGLTQAASLIYPASSREYADSQEPVRSSTWGRPVQKTDSQAVLCELGDYAETGDLLAAFVGSELRGLNPVICHEGRLATYLQIFSDISGEPVSFKLMKSDSDIAIDLGPGLNTLPGTNIGDFQTNTYFSLYKSDPGTPSLTTALINAYPNPFNSSTSISLNVEKDNTPVKLEIYNLKGQKVKTLFQGQLPAGTQNIAWNGTNENGQQVASGIYFCHLSSASINQSLKLMILK